jgi:hypothetical protein
MNETDTQVQENTEAIEKAPVLYPQTRIRIGLIGTFLGFLLVVLGAKPEFFGMDRSPVIGFAQTATFLLGIGVIGLSGYFTLMSFWPKGYTTITADFGIRLLATGWLIAVFAGMADVFSIGSHPVTGLVFFGRVQAAGVEIGEMVMGIGMVMMIMPPHSSLRIKPEDSISRIDMNE